MPGDPQRVTLLDGPIVLAALTSKEPELLGKNGITPQYEHQYVLGRDWQAGHYLVRTLQGTVACEPLYEISDQRYSVYFSVPK